VALTAYFDDSGSVNDTAATTVAGYIGLGNDWLSVAMKWEAALREEGITVPFHMKEFRRGAYPEFSKFYNQPDLQNRVLKKLITIIQPAVLHSFSNSVLATAYREIDQRYYFKEAFGGMYSFCGWHCVVKAREWGKQNGFDEKDIVFVFEQGTPGNSELVEVMVHNGLPEPSFGPKTLPPLQAADHVAWENHYKLGQPDSDPVRETLSFLHDVVPNTWEYHRLESLEWFCKRFDIKPKK
jgi:hypothetical protein